MSVATAAPDAVAAPAAGRYARDVLAGVSARHALASIVVAALLIRLALLATPRAFFPDEVFQYLEPAHRMVFGSGVVTWEFRYGIRSYLLPLLLAGPMALGGWIDPQGAAYLLLPKLLMVAIGTTAIVSAHAIGRRTSPAHGLFAAFVVAIWSEYALFATQALTESVAVPIFLAGAACLYAARDRAAMLVAAGGLLALAAILRFQYAPAVGLFVLLSFGLSPRRWLWGGIGAAVAVAVEVAIDLAMGQAPFGWILANVHQNIVVGRSHAWVDGPFYYVQAIVATWGLLFVPIAYLAWVGTRREPALMAVAITNIVAHSMIAHKEYRYILLSSMLLVLLAAIGTVDIVRYARGRTGNARLATAGAVWLLASGYVAAQPFTAGTWAYMSPKLQALQALRAEGRTCGIALAGMHWSSTGGDTYLHRPAPIYVADDAVPVHAWLATYQAGFDTVLAPQDAAAAMPKGFVSRRCFGLGGRYPAGNSCIYRRPGACEPGVASRYEINTYLRRIDR